MSGTAPVAVLTAVDPSLEAGVATRLEQARSARLVRRCADVAELVSAAAAGVAAAAVVSADVPALDRSVLGGLEDDGLVVVGVYLAGDELAQRRLRQWGVRRTIGADAPAAEWEDLFEGLATTAAEPVTGPGGTDAADPAAGRDDLGDVEDVGDRDRSTTPDDLDAAIADELLGGAGTGRAPGSLGSTRATDRSDPPQETARGRVLTVWGPAGAPGRTLVAVNLAVELSALGHSVLLVDADTYAASVGQSLALLDEAPGLAAATRLADTGDLDLPALAAVAPQVRPGLRVLTGLPRADRWSEIRADAVEEVLRVGRLLAEVIVVDTSFCLEEDEELSYDTRAPRRNAATTTAVREADQVMVVGGADPVGLQRLVRGLDDLRSVGRPDRIVVNRVRSAAVGASPERRIRETLQRFAGVEGATMIPDDPQSADGAMLVGRTLLEHAPSSPARQAIARLAADLVGQPALVRRRRLTRFGR